MPSPFPGMNPYLENPDLWTEVHHLLISLLAETLNPRLLPKYRAAIEKRVYLSGEEILFCNYPPSTIILPFPLPPHPYLLLTLPLFHLPMSSYPAIYSVVCQIPYGQVATYGQVAELANLPGRARLVGYALYRVAPDSDIPWHRVINAKGEISESPVRYGSDYLQRSRLEAEGIAFNAQGKIDLRKYLWKPTLEG